MHSAINFLKNTKHYERILSFSKFLSACTLAIRIIILLMLMVVVTASMLAKVVGASPPSAPGEVLRMEWPLP